MPNKKLGEILLEKGLITETQLKVSLEEQKISKQYLGAILINKKFVKEEDLMRALSEQFNIPFVHLKDQPIDWDTCVRYLSTIASEKKALAIYSDEDTVIVAVRDPLDTISLSSIELTARPKRMRLVLVCESELQEFIQECRRRARGSIKQLLDEG